MPAATAGIELHSPSGDHSPPARIAHLFPRIPIAMQVRINGESRHLEHSLSLPELLEFLDLGGKRVAVEHNGVIVPRSRHANTHVCYGDELLIVQDIGGGLRLFVTSHTAFPHRHTVVWGKRG